MTYLKYSSPSGEYNHSNPQNDSSFKRLSLYQPIIEIAPNKAITIDEYIVLVENFEKLFPENEQRNTKKMITRLRKIYYNSDGWNNELIKGTNEISILPYITSQIEKERFKVKLPFVLDDFEIVRKYQKTQDLTSLIEPDIFLNQEVMLTKHPHYRLSLDIGHVFAGLDAYNNPNEVGVPLFKVDRNIDAVTWVGDIGSNLTEIIIEGLREEQSNISKEKAQAIIQAMSPGRDMLGNIDAYSIALNYNTLSGLKVSEILWDYYLVDHKNLQQKRFLTFSENIGLKKWNGSSFANEDEVVEKYQEEIGNAAAMYLWANSDLGLNVLSNVMIIFGASSNDLKIDLVKIFFSSLKKAIK